MSLPAPTVPPETLMSHLGSRVRRPLLVRSKKRSYLLVALLAAPIAVVPARADTTGVVDAPARVDARRLERRSEHVVIISLDGLRPDAIDKFGARTLQRLMREGTYTLNAQTILPSKTLPSHTSML